jgi:hypothetical protein
LKSDKIPASPDLYGVLPSGVAFTVAEFTQAQRDEGRERAALEFGCSKLLSDVK